MSRPHGPIPTHFLVTGAYSCSGREPVDSAAMAAREPFGYFLTFVTYGSHLPGGPKATISKDHNGYGQPGIGDRPVLEDASRAQMKHPEVLLDGLMRATVETAIREHCEFKSWTLHALNVRTNHVHVVVSARDEPPDAVLRQFKSWATRKVRDSGLLGPDVRPWARGGSKRYAWSEADLAEVVDYVLFQQGDPLT